MSIEVPSRGQPIDYNYMYKIVDQINTLTASIAPRAVDSKFNDGTNTVTMRTGNLVIVAGYYDVTKVAKSETLDSEETFSYDFGVTFKYPPIVIAQIVAKDTSVASKGADAIVTGTGTSNVNISVKFKTKGDANVGVNLIAVGVPVITTS